MKKENWIWPLCKDCDMPYCTAILFIGRDPFGIPNDYKCTNIRVAETKMWEKASKLYANRCRRCGLSCEDPRIKTGKGGSSCEKKNGLRHLFKPIKYRNNFQKILKVEFAH